jgi:Brp/Blh family beta-carotene 15,15'-monooxygenase
MTTTDARHTLVRLTVVPGWVVLAGASLLFVAGLSLPLRYQFLPLVVSVALFGLPHGAIDHLAPTRVQGRRATPRTLAAVGVLYAVVGGVYAAAWFVVPVASFAVFILLTWLHWGQGEVHSLAALLGVSHLQTPTQRLLTALSRGTLPMLVPLVAFPDQYRFVAETLVGLFTDPTLGWATVVFTESGRLAVAGLITALFAVTLVLGYLRADERRDWVVDAGEVALLLLFFGTVPPILAVGLYFTCWHSLRHIGRLMAIDPGTRQTLTQNRYGQALARFGSDAAPLTAVSVLFLGVLYWLVPVTPGSLSEWVGLYLVLIAALTFPHVLVVVWLDREQAVWTSRPVLLTERIK